MRELGIDIETYSSVDLLKSGAYAYAEAPDFEIMLFGYCCDGGTVHVVDLMAGEEIPPEIREAILSPDVTKTAYNAAFERICLSKYFAPRGQFLSADSWSCTMVMAWELGLPGTLDAVGRAIGLSDETRKMKEGQALIPYFTKPCKPTKVNGGRCRNLPEHAPEKWEQFKAYNQRDVVAEQAVRKKLTVYTVHKDEQLLYVIDQQINDRGVCVQTKLAKHAIAFEAINTDRVTTKARELTGLENPRSDTQLKRWIKDTTGITVSSLDKKTIHTVYTRLHRYPNTIKALDLRASLTRTSIGKYEAMLRGLGTDGRVRGLLQFYGAGRTGRWAGRLVQIQNLPRLDDLTDAEIATARDAVLSGDVNELDFIFDDVAYMLSKLIRTAFVPREGCRFIVSDFSAIEARVIAWLSGEKWRLDVFNDDGKIYEASAERMFGLPTGSVQKGDPMRQRGKVAELALGYGGSVGALKQMGALQNGLSEDELKPLVDAWRGSNQRIVRFWWQVDAAAKKAIQERTAVDVGHGIRFRMEGPLLRLRLPSGRELSYVHPRVSDGDITYMGINSYTKAWERIETYGPKLVENIVQAASRDCLAQSLPTLARAGYPIVFHVHDEVVIEMPHGKGSAEEVAAIMGTAKPWTTGLPLQADAFECNYYQK